VDAEAITTLQWMRGPNLTSSNDVDSCGNSTNDVEYFGDSGAPPDPQSGGLVLVGGGAVTPPGTSPWRGPFALPENLELQGTPAPPTVLRRLSESMCKPFTASSMKPTPTATGSPSSAFSILMVLFFPLISGPTFRASASREAIPRCCNPAPAGTLATMNVYDCPSGCTGPQSAPGAASLNPLWDPLQGWYAVHNPTALEGVVVRRVASLDPQGHPTVPQLWIDNDGGVQHQCFVRSTHQPLGWL
jgi:hypothetical protein